MERRGLCVLGHVQCSARTGRTLTGWTCDTDRLAVMGGRDDTPDALEVSLALPVGGAASESSESKAANPLQRIEG